MSALPIDAVEQFIRNEIAIAAMRPPRWTDYAAYEAAKVDFAHRHPEATSEQYERAVRAIAKRTGV